MKTYRFTRHGYRRWPLSVVNENCSPPLLLQDDNLEHPWIFLSVAMTILLDYFAEENEAEANARKTGGTNEPILSVGEVGHIIAVHCEECNEDFDIRAVSNLIVTRKRWVSLKLQFTCPAGHQCEAQQHGQTDDDFLEERGILP